MADSDDKTQDGAHKKTLTLKGGPAVGARPGLSRSGRPTVVVERKTRVVPHGNTGAPARPAGNTPASATPRPAAGGAPARDGGRPQLRTPSAVPRSAGLSTAEAEARARALREAGARQVDGVRLALAHGCGGVLSATSTVVLGSER